MPGSTTPIDSHCPVFEYISYRIFSARTDNRQLGHVDRLCIAMSHPSHLRTGRWLAEVHRLDPVGVCHERLHRVPLILHNSN